MEVEQVGDGSPEALFGCTELEITYKQVSSGVGLEERSGIEKGV